MHDPMTVICDIPNLFARRHPWGKKWSDRPTLVTVWHVDPETDGTDDSCDWPGWKVSNELREKLKKTGEQEWQYYFGKEFGSMRFSSDLEILWGVWSAVAWRFGKKTQLRTNKEINEIFYLAGNPTDNLLHSVQEAKFNEEGMGHLFYIVYCNYARLHRPWWKHPRWHIHHWRLQFHPIQNFKRWAFSRCAGCGKRFQWGESPTSTQWDSTGPLWFKSERNIYHSSCIPAPMQVAKTGTRSEIP